MQCDVNITPKIKWIKAPREDYDCLDDGVKLVAHEVKFYFSGQIQGTSGQTNTYLKLEICWTFELLPGGDAADWVQRARTGGHLSQTWLQVSFYSCFLLLFYSCLCLQTCVQQHWLPNYRYSNRGLLKSLLDSLRLKIFLTCDLVQNICRCASRTRCARSANMAGPSWGLDLFRFVHNAWCNSNLIVIFVRRAILWGSF